MKPYPLLRPDPSVTTEKKETIKHIYERKKKKKKHSREKLNLSMTYFCYLVNTPPSNSYILWGKFQITNQSKNSILDTGPLYSLCWIISIPFFIHFSLEYYDELYLSLLVILNFCSTNINFIKDHQYNIPDKS